MILQKSDIDYLIATAKLAGKAILEVYDSADFFIEKKEDSSPLTLADKKSNDIITARLAKFGIPILSEEGKEILYEERKNWQYFWCVDPLDGTKEFIKKNGEFTVNIALIQQNVPIWGIVYAPVLDWFYYIDENKIVIKQIDDTTTILPQKEKDYTKIESGVRVVASRSHLDDRTKAFINELNQPEVLSMGSSLKFMLLAEGKADVYPRFSPTMEWDTAAAQAILYKLGYSLVTNNNEISYNKENLVNNYFIAK